MTKTPSLTKSRQNVTNMQIARTQRELYISALGRGRKDGQAEAGLDGLAHGFALLPHRLGADVLELGQVVVVLLPLLPAPQRVLCTWKNSIRR